MIATPIILNIINDSKKSSNERSIELYGKAVENAIGSYQVTHPEDNDITLEKIQDDIKYSGNDVKCEITINSDGTVYLSECKVDKKEVDYTYGVKPICTLVEGESQKVGSKYECNLDEKRIFYVLENNPESDTITLLMEKNYEEEGEVPKTMAWCDQSGSNPEDNKCNHDGLDLYVEKIQVKFGNKVTVGIPSYEQVMSIGCLSSDKSCPTWAYDYMLATLNSVSGVYGYWTSTSDSSDSRNARYVSRYGRLDFRIVSNGNFDGLRPVITISKSDLS